VIVIYRVTVHFAISTCCCINGISFDMPLSVALHRAHNIVSTLMAARFARTHVRGAPVVHFLCGLRPRKRPLEIIRSVQRYTCVRSCLLGENVTRLSDEPQSFREQREFIISETRSSCSETRYWPRIRTTTILSLWSNIFHGILLCAHIIPFEIFIFYE